MTKEFLELELTELQEKILGEVVSDVRRALLEKIREIEKIVVDM